MGKILNTKDIMRVLIADLFSKDAIE